MTNKDKKADAKAHAFPVTDWGAMDRLRQAEGEDEVDLLNVLANRYWNPLYQFLRAQGMDEEGAKDAVQGFFAFALETRMFQAADRRKGRLRNFLLKSLKNFLANTHRKAVAKKRHPAGGIVSLDYLASAIYFQPPSLKDNRTPEDRFHQAWVRELVANVVKALERESSLRGHRIHFELFQKHVVAPELDGYAAPSLDELARQYSCTYKEASNRIGTAKRAFRRLLLEEVRRYASSEDDILKEEDDVVRVLRLGDGAT